MSLQPVPCLPAPSAPGQASQDRKVVPNYLKPENVITIRPGRAIVPATSDRDAFAEIKMRDGESLRVNGPAVALADQLGGFVRVSAVDGGVWIQAAAVVRVSPTTGPDGVEQCVIYLPRVTIETKAESMADFVARLERGEA